jgi:hypothetical protein
MDINSLAYFAVLIPVLLPVAVIGIWAMVLTAMNKE